MSEIHQDEVAVLKDDIEAADSITELQSAVLLVNETFASADEDVTLSGMDDYVDRLDSVVECMNAFRSRLEELSEAGNISSYSVSLGGSITGPSLSVRVTSEVDP
ncbi:hypothetical protein [Halorussus salinus]|uniref:hypothetical protein n=1 Tax=Halorussus salinus TaxID=1364935 RepID=UPI0010927D59|nr:hypothetical protein [Halorussus salinus]